MTLRLSQLISTKRLLVIIGAVGDKTPPSAAYPQKAVITHGKIITCGAGEDERLKVYIAPIFGTEKPVGVTGPYSSSNPGPVRWQIGVQRLWYIVDYGVIGGFDLSCARTENLFRRSLSLRKDGKYNGLTYLAGGGPLSQLRLYGRAARFPAIIQCDYWQVTKCEILQFVITNVRTQLVTKSDMEAGKGMYQLAQTDEERKAPAWSFVKYRIQGSLHRMPFG